MKNEVWERCVKNWMFHIAELKVRGVEVSDLKELRGIPESQIEKFERATGLRLSDEFKDLVRITGGASFYWWWQEDEAGALPEDLIEFESGGNSEFDLIGATKTWTLLKLYEAFQESYEGYEVEDPKQRELIKNCFPLYLNDGDGNALALRLDTDPCEVHYLDGEFCWHLFEGVEYPDARDSSICGMGLLNFLESWSNVGSPSVAAMDYVLSRARKSSFDSESVVSKAWLELVTS